MARTRTNWCVCLTLLLAVGHDQIKSAEPIPPVDILSSIRAGGVPHKKPQPVSPQWVGTVKIVALHDPHGVYKDDTPDHIRITHAWSDRENRLNVGRVDSNRYLGSDVARYYPALPDAKEIAAAPNLATLHQWLGQQHGPSDGAGWVCFTTTKEGQLRWLNVFAHLSDPFAPGPADTKIDTIVVREGLFRPADPASEEERKQFKTAKDIYAEMEAREQMRTNLHPEPLRSLVAARKTPRDHDLVNYKSALNAARRSPDGRLLAQLVERMHEGTLEMRSYLEDILTRQSDYLKIEPWEPARHATALRQTLVAMSGVHDADALQDLTIILLMSLGGGHIEVADPKIDLVAKISENSREYTSKRFDVNDQNLKEAVRKIQQWFRANYPQLKAP